MNVPDKPEIKTSVHTLAKGAGIALFGRSFSRILLLAAQAFLAQVLGPQSYGLFSLGWSILQISANTGQIGLPQAVIRFGAKYWQQDDASFRGVVQQSLALTLIVSLLLGGGIYIFSPGISLFFSKPGLTPVLRGTAIALVLLLLLKVLSAVTRISQRMQYSAIAEDLLPAVSLLLGAFIFVQWMHKGLAGGVYGLVLAYAVGLMVALGFVRSLYPGVLALVRSPSFWRRLISFSLPASAASIFGVLSRWSARLFLGYLYPEAEVGIYQAAAQLASFAAVILTAMNTVFAPMIAQLFGVHKIRELDQLYKITTKWTIYLIAPAIIPLFFLSREVMLLVYGAAYVRGASALSILLIGQFINAASGAVMLLLLMVGHERKWMLIAAGALFLTLVLNSLLVPLWGMEGAALVDTISLSAFNFSGLIVLKKVVHLWPHDRRYIKGIIAGLTSVLVTLALKLFAWQHVWVEVVVVGVVSVAVFLAVLILQGLDEEDMDFIHFLRSRLSSLG